MILLRRLGYAGLVTSTRSLGLAARRPEATATPSTAPSTSRCLLCDDDDLDDGPNGWATHVRSPSHIARHAVGQAFAAAPSSSGIGAESSGKSGPNGSSGSVASSSKDMMRHLWAELQLDYRQIDAINGQRQGKRRARLHSTIAYLKDMNVLVHSILRRADDPAGDDGSPRVTYYTSKEFPKCVHVGDAFLQCELTDRLCRLMPNASAPEISATLSTVSSKAKLGTLYDLLNLAALMGVPTLPAKGAPGLDWKAAVCAAILGELQLFINKERQVAIDSTADADKVVLCVLASHSLENIVSELVHAVLQQLVEDAAAVWDDYIEDRRQAQAVAATSAFVSRHLPFPTAAPAHPGGRATPHGAPDAATAVDLTRQDSLRIAPPPPPPTTARGVTTSWTKLLRTGALEVSVPTPANKMAMFAACVPKLAPRAKSTPAASSPAASRKAASAS